MSHHLPCQQCGGDHPTKFCKPGISGMKTPDELLQEAEQMLISHALGYDAEADTASCTYCGREESAEERAARDEGIELHHFDNCKYIQWRANVLNLLAQSEDTEQEQFEKDGWPVDTDNDCAP